MDPVQLDIRRTLRQCLLPDYAAEADTDGSQNGGDANTGAGSGIVQRVERQARELQRQMQQRLSRQPQLLAYQCPVAILLAGLQYARRRLLSPSLRVDLPVPQCSYSHLFESISIHDM